MHRQTAYLSQPQFLGSVFILMKLHMYFGLNRPASAKADAGALARVSRLADSRGRTNSSGLFVISLIKIGMKLYKRPRIGMNEGWRNILFQGRLHRS